MLPFRRHGLGAWFGQQSKATAGHTGEYGGRPEPSTGVKASAVDNVALRKILPAASREGYLPLLLLADESKEQVLSYYQFGHLFALHRKTGETLGNVHVLLPGQDEAELKAIAVN